MQELLNSPVFTWVIVPCLICLARITDVSLGTLRIIFISRGMKLFAPFVGFFEILIWLVAITQVMNNLNNIAHFLSYAVGFSLGNYLGILLEEKLAMGKNIITIVIPGDASLLIHFLREKGFSVTVVDGKGAKGDVHVLFTVIRRSELNSVVSIIKRFHPKAFYTVEDIRFVSGGVFPAISNTSRFKFLSFLNTGK
ncbi:MAG: DUF2179 domain-containing protein [Desulfobulbus oligotrophicus]|jgi:uncharacterized protein YebE (UPF0316 family)|nr:DUF2179 domain-containing protein [Desulfobulbus oligotrophicus]